MRMPALVACAVLCALQSTTFVSGTETPSPGHLHSSDPLTEPAPQLLKALSLAKDEQRPEERVVAGLWAEALATSEGSLKVIVTLREPELLATGMGQEDLESLRLRSIAALEHQFASAASSIGMKDLRGLSHFPIVFGEVPPQRLLDLASLPQVFAIEEDLPILATRSEGASLIRATQLRNQEGATGAGVGVAVVDSGVSPHPELAARIVAQGNFTTDPGDGTVDGTGHGTSVAGIIAGSSGGVAPQANIWAVKVFDSSGAGDTSQAITALNALFADRTSFGGLDLINMSLGTPGFQSASFCDSASPAYTAVVNQLLNVGVVVFAASGNEGVKNGVSLPACLSNTIAVGAVYDANIGRAAFPECVDSTTSADQIACFSNSGPSLSILAPSFCARTPTTGGQYENCFGGTSAASPYASGVAAQLLSLRPQTTPQELFNAMALTGNPRTDVNGITRNRIDAVSAFAALAGTGGTEDCTPDATTLCIDDQPGDRRFRVTMQFSNNQGSGSSNAIPLTSLGVTRGGLFWIGSQGNPEMLIKVLNGCSTGLNSYWVFYAATTNQGLVTTVTDTETGRVWTRTNPQGTAAAPVQDTRAFPCQ